MHTVIDAPPLPFLPTGYPLALFSVLALPSLNDIIYLSPKSRAAAIKEVVALGRSIAGEWLQANSYPVVVTSKRGASYLCAKRPPVFDVPIFCFVEIIRPDARRRDIYNPAIKALIDGMTDAGLWVDDSEDYHTDLWVHYGGVVPGKGRVDIRLYESA
jgi:hypothetical protein